jgi:DNA polymerase-3 subunit delta'
MLLPRENLNLFGHQEALDFLLNAFHSPRFPHAWIIGGAFGTGKATLAHHFARYILSGRQDKDTLFSKDAPLYRRCLAQSHGDLWSIGGDEASEIGVEPLRELNAFLNQTSFEGGWRVVIIDGAEKLNRNAANTILKRLEEPPPKTIFLLTTTTAGRLLPTIRSRCQLLPLNPLKDDDVKQVLQSQGVVLPEFFSLAQGSPGRLLRLMEGEGPQIYSDLQEILKGNSAASFIHTHGGDEASYRLIEDFTKETLYKTLKDHVEKGTAFFGTACLETILEKYHQVENLFKNCQFAQLDKRTTLTAVFAILQNRTSS